MTPRSSPVPARRRPGGAEHTWAHVFGAAGDGFVTVITDLTAVVAGQGRAQLLDLVPGRSAYKNAAVDALPEAATVMDPFHVVALPGHKLDLLRHRHRRRARPRRGSRHRQPA
jgi:transposase